MKGRTEVSNPNTAIRLLRFITQIITGGTTRRGKRMANAARVIVAVLVFALVPQFLTAQSAQERQREEQERQAEQQREQERQAEQQREEQERQAEQQREEQQRQAEQQREEQQREQERQAAQQREEQQRQAEERQREEQQRQQQQWQQQQQEQQQRQAEEQQRQERMQQPSVQQPRWSQGEPRTGYSARAAESSSVTNYSPKNVSPSTSLLGIMASPKPSTAAAPAGNISAASTELLGIMAARSPSAASNPSQKNVSSASTELLGIMASPKGAVNNNPISGASSVSNATAAVGAKPGATVATAPLAANGSQGVAGSQMAGAVISNQIAMSEALQQSEDQILLTIMENTSDPQLKQALAQSIGQPDPIADALTQQLQGLAAISQASAQRAAQAQQAAQQQAQQTAQQAGQQSNASNESAGNCPTVPATWVKVTFTWTDNFMGGGQNVEPKIWDSGPERIDYVYKEHFEDGEGDQFWQEGGYLDPGASHSLPLCYNSGNGLCKTHTPTVEVIAWRDRDFNDLGATGRACQSALQFLLDSSH